MRVLVDRGRTEIPSKTRSSLLRLVPFLSLVLCFLSVKIYAVTEDILPDTISQRVAACYACHDKDGQAASGGFYPRIAGKPSGYLFNQLINFREGRRANQQMTYLVDHQSDAYLREIADYFSTLHPPYPAPQLTRVPPPTFERGRVLVTLGDATKNIPACISCHGKLLTGLEPAIPGLIGLPQDYLNAQLGAWKSGLRHAAAPDCMAQIASRLDASDINAAAAWLAAQNAAVQTTVPAPISVKLPLQCGSVPEHKE